jgi:hypothetical protein
MVLDVTLVGAALTTAQQDATLEDLAFFLDEFGSTHAVRVKLGEQESDATRLREQVRLLLLGQTQTMAQGEETGSNQQETDIMNSSESAAEGVDETMANLDFFLSTFGSTQAVRTKLEALKLEIAGLRSTVQWLEEFHRMGNMPKSGTGAEQVSGLERNVEGVEQQGRRVERSGGGDRERGRVEKPGAVPSEAPKVVISSPERCQEQGRHFERRDAQASVGVPLVGKDFINSGVVSAYYSALQSATKLYAGSRPSNASRFSDDSDRREQLKPQQMSTTSSTKYGAVMTSRRKHKNRTICRFPDCGKVVQARGLCWGHGGYRMCKIHGCDGKQASRGLCLIHGRCKISGCDKLSSPTLRGYCKRHARE